MSVPPARTGPSLARWAVLVVVMALVTACSSQSPPPFSSSSTLDTSTTSHEVPGSTEPNSPAGKDSSRFIVTGGTVVSLDGSGDHQAMAVNGDRIAGVGTEQEMVELMGEGTRLVDLGGRFVFPGFIDSHSHWYQHGRLGDYTPEEVNQILLSRGWTGTNDINVEPHFAPDLFEWHETGRIALRMNAYLSLNTPGTDQDRHGDWFRELGIEPGSMIGDRLRIPGVKIFIASDWDRVVKWSEEELTAEITEYHDRGWQIAAKQISDESLDLALAAFGAIFEPGEDRRHRLEHALELRSDQIPRVAELGLVPVVQLGAIESDFQHEEGFAEMISDDGIERVWPFQEMADADLPLVGSMAVVPLEGLRGPFTISVMQMLHGAMTGVSEVGNTPWSGREPELMTMEQALGSITSRAAWSTFEENDRGTLTEGKLADFVVMSGDLRDGADDPDILREVDVDATFVGGELLWCGFGLDDFCSSFGQPIPERLLFHENLAPLESGQSNPPPSTSNPTPPATAVDSEMIAAVSASNQTQQAINAVDGDSETVWSSGDGPPQWIELDLGDPRAVVGLRLLVDQHPPGPTVHQIFGGDDPNPPQLLAEISGETAWGDWLEVELDATIRYLRIVTVTSPSWVSWFEIEVVPG